MTTSTTFIGFPPTTLVFLRALRDHADRDWFAAHRAEYLASYDAPAKALVTALAERVGELSPDLQAVPRVGGSIIRVNRDRRFAPDAPPYKGWIDLWLWEGDRAMAPGGLYLRITPDVVRVAAGVRAMDRATLARYRLAVCDPVTGPALARVVAALAEDGLVVEGQTLKGVPRDLPARAEVDHTCLDLLRHTALVIDVDQPAEGLVTDGPALVELAMTTWRRAWPLHRWLIDHVQPWS